MRTKRYVPGGLSLVLILWLGVAMATEATKADKPIKVMQIWFEQSEAGIQPYVTRLLVTNHFLRFDDGVDDGNFVLFDRHSREVHNFNHEDRSHILIRPQPLSPVDFEMDYRVTSNVLDKAPRINGNSPVEHRFYADNQLCKTSVNVDGLLPDAVDALMDFEMAVAAQGLQTLDLVPAAMQSACFMANNYLHVIDYLKPGFPLSVSDNQGRQKRLLRFEEVEKPLQLFQLAEDYRVFYPTLND